MKKRRKTTTKPLFKKKSNWNVIPKRTVNINEAMVMFAFEVSHESQEAELRRPLKVKLGTQKLHRRSYNEAEPEADHGDREEDGVPNVAIAGKVSIPKNFTEDHITKNKTLARQLAERTSNLRPVDLSLGGERKGHPKLGGRILDLAIHHNRPGVDIYFMIERSHSHSHLRVLFEMQSYRAPRKMII
ncbi:hypothetical protein CRG98_015312 [Punica granatum]|uniref:Uncharacterized protein n=1 Tax=Punica granatum TaxID=22663 RepID=A0A2I0K6X5_PUNGR|nr:hypothetical protein CRG98_015312 [Punica granatum]